jgi:GTPase
VPVPTVALVGYTNAGKSTLLNALTGAEVGVRDRLFHTLDPTTRMLKWAPQQRAETAVNGTQPREPAVKTPGRAAGRSYLLTDTVGFISKLPHQLVDAFGATLEETRRADLLAHVLDGSVPEAQAAIMQRSVEQTLEEIGAGERPRLLVLNKVDLLDEEARDELRLRHPDAVLVSGTTGDGLGELCERIEGELLHTLRPVELLVPYADGGSLAELHKVAGEVNRTDTPEGVRVSALVPARLAERFARFAVAPQL